MRAALAGEREQERLGERRVSPLSSKMSNGSPTIGRLSTFSKLGDRNTGLSKIIGFISSTHFSDEYTALKGT